MVVHKNIRYVWSSQTLTVLRLGQYTNGNGISPYGFFLFFLIVKALNFAHLSVCCYLLQLHYNTQMENCHHKPTLSNSMSVMALNLHSITYSSGIFLTFYDLFGWKIMSFKTVHISTFACYQCFQWSKWEELRNV